ncbi:hypothetical protein LOAG_11642 [Loa loa]|uniref:Uncharacterized protein n=1 Tax=Loa loa TaxID=7209 RepID=A0A1S0TN77_LOALO|nr:hypothetical protein LOAG_11642 [Loa loa]EFO16862.1 hypothetical protein LOAG_11642 [Loa loa]
MDPNSKFHPESSTASTSPMKEMELGFEPVVSGLPAESAVLITAKQLTTQTVGGEDTYDVIASPSGSSDGSSEFVKVEHSDVQQR